MKFLQYLFTVLAIGIISRIVAFQVTTYKAGASYCCNKHPDTSIIVKFDQNGNLVTLKGEAYTPTGDIRVNFVDHGADLTQEGDRLSFLGNFPFVIIPTINRFSAVCRHSLSAVIIHLNLPCPTSKFCVLLGWYVVIPYSINILTQVLSLNLTKT
jgi:hypothetical protein